MNMKQVTLILLAVGLTPGAGTSAEALPDYYPERFHSSGVVHAINLGQSVIVNGTRISLDSNVKVHTLRSKFSPVQAVEVGSEIGYTVVRDQSGREKIDQIWVLPEGTVPQL